jgi:hypothetical protein
MSRSQSARAVLAHAVMASLAHMLAALRSESVREPEEVFLVDRIQDSDSRPLDDLVLKGDSAKTKMGCL